MAKKATQNTPATPFGVAAPPPKSGDAIELTPLLGKAIAIRCLGRSKVKTKFGDRNLSQVEVIVDGHDEPLEGVIFASYFQSLPLYQWFVGKVMLTARKTWGMDANGIPASAMAHFATVAATLANVTPEDPIGSVE